MKKIVLLCALLTSCTYTADDPPAITEMPKDLVQYHKDLDYCWEWAKPTDKEKASRSCFGMGCTVTLFWAVTARDDQRDNDPERKAMPKSEYYRLNICLAKKGYKTTPVRRDSKFTYVDVP